MTSKRSFFNYMKEDLRHKVWMIALSVLGNFMAILVAFLIAEDDVYRYSMEKQMYVETYLGSIISFFREAVIPLGGIIALIGAAIVGVFGFRFLFSKKMVDTYHSLPIKRNTLFWVYYLDGILIWLVPFLTSLLITLVIAATKVFPLGGGWTVFAAVLKNAGISVCVLVIGFLLIYHLVLVAVMLSGNVFNTLVTACILGCAAISVYGLGYVFFEYYMDTFYATGELAESVIYASPMVSSVFMLVAASENELAIGFTRVINVNFIVMLLLGVAAWRFYCKRASELAEQGVKNKIATTIMKLLASVLGGMGGWLVFVLITSTNSMGWGIFGCILVSVLVYGVLDIIFHMDFKAFLANKIWMLASTVVALCTCLSFNMDWFGFDEYLPKQEKIQSLAIYAEPYTNHYFNDSEDNALKVMEYQDSESIYRFLSTAVDNLDYNDSDYEGLNLYYGDPFDYVNVKVTINSGRSYYRQYKMFQKDIEVLRPIVFSQEYAQSNFVIGEEQRKNIYRVSIRTENSYIEEEEQRREVLDDLITAYNQDVVENPERVILGEGRLMVQLRMYNNRYNNYYLDIYETMEHTMAALEKHGYGKAVGEIPYEKVESITLSLGEDYNKYELGQDFESDYELMARERFGVWDAESLERYRQYKEKIREAQNRRYEGLSEYKEQAVAMEELIKEISITITDPKEIAELMPLLHYDSAYYDSGVMKKCFVRGVTLKDTNGGVWDLYMRENELPLKYIERFAQWQK